MQDRNDVMWIATDSGLFRRDPGTGAVTAYQHDANNPSSLAFDDLYGLAQDAAGRIWIATYGGGLDALDPRTEQFTHYRKDAKDPASLNNNGALAVFADSANQIWVGTWGGGLSHLDPQTGKITPYLNDPNDPTSLSSNFVEAIVADRAGAMWIATFGGGLNRFDPQTGTFTRYRNDPAEPDSISHNNLLTLFLDNSDLLWIGTEGGGINVLDLSPQPFNLYRHSASDANSLTSGAVIALTKDQDGSLWVGTSSGGLDQLDRQTSTFTHYRHDPKVASSLISNYVIELFLDNQDTLWIGTGNGLDHFDRATQTFRHYQHDADNPNSLSENNIYCIEQAADGALWIGTYNGLNRFDPQTGRFTHFFHDPNKVNSLTSNLITALRLGQGDTLWVGTNKGLNRLDRATGNIERFQHDPANPHSLSGDNISALLTDPRGSLWIATRGYGLNKLDPKTGEVKRYGEREGLASSRIVGLMLDPQANDGAGDLWLGTGRGLSRLNLRDETIRNYDSGDGLPETGFVYNSYFQAPDGEMFAGGTEGFVSFYPSAVHDRVESSPVVLTKFLVNNQPARVDARGPLTKSLDDAMSVTLPPGTQSFAIGFAVLDLREPNNTRYRYRLDGFDRDWIATDSTQRLATYTSLDPGTYTFRVKGANGDGVWGEQERSLAITIEPMWWQTWWARGLALVAVISLLVGAYEGRVRWLKRRQRDLELQVAERTNELTNLLAVSQSLTRTHELAPLLAEILDALAQVIPYSGACVLIREGEDLVVGALRADLPTTPQGVRFPLNVIRPLDKAIQTGEPFVLRDLQTDKLLADTLGELLSSPAVTRAWLGAPLRIKDEVIGLLLTAHTEPDHYTEKDIPLLSQFANQAALAIENARLNEQAQQAAVTEERNRLARELHDSVTQSLYSITLYADAADRAIHTGKEELGSRQLKELKQLAAEATLEMRMLIYQMRPQVLQAKGLAAALKARLNAVEARAGIRVEFSAQNERRLPYLVEAELYGIAQEALANIIKHARASRIGVRLDYEDTRLVMELSDDGSGFDLARAQEKGTMGLQTMRERAEKIHGTLAIMTQLQRGTTIRVEVPYD